MFGWLKRNVAPVAAVAMFSLASVAAQALSVSFYTTAAFNDAPASPGTSPVTLYVGDASLTFTGVTVNNLIVPDSGDWVTGAPNFADGFGTFAFDGGSQNVAIPNGTTFTLYISQTSPVASPNLGSFDASITGTINKNNSGGLTIEWNGPFVQYIPDAATAQVRYMVDAPIDIPSGYPLTLDGAVAAAPLPGVAVVGAALMGGLGLIRRRRETAAA